MNVYTNECKIARGDIFYNISQPPWRFSVSLLEIR